MLFHIGRHWFGCGILSLSLGTYLLAFYIGIVLDILKSNVTAPNVPWRRTWCTWRSGRTGGSGDSRDSDHKSDTGSTSAAPSNEKPIRSRAQQNESLSPINGEFGGQLEKESGNGLEMKSEKEPALESTTEIHSSRHRKQTDLSRVLEGRVCGLPTPRTGALC